jgi:hypothetical protein
MTKLKDKVKNLQSDVNYLTRTIHNLEEKINRRKFMQKRFQMRLFRGLVLTSLIITTIVYVYDTFTK